MGTIRPLLLGAVVCLFALPAGAATHYVATNGHHNTPFTSWYDAATNIQAAVDVATNGSSVVVSNGTYGLASQITVTNGITLVSLNGQEVTVVTGSSTARCVSLMHSNTVLRGFTIRGGNALDGAGVYLYNGGHVEDCAILNNRTESIYYGGRGAGIHVALDGVISGCTIISNIAGRGWGGGIYAANAVTVSNCVISHNSGNYGDSAHPYAGYGGGLDLRNGGTVRHCVIENNNAGSGGGLRCAGSWIEGCRIVSNETWFSYGFQSAWGGGIMQESTSRIENCLIAYNQGGSSGGGVHGSPTGIVQNCTIVNNHDGGGGGGSLGGGTCGANLRNCVVWGNTGVSGLTTNVCNYTNGTITYTCTWPLPDSGAGNFTNAPLFADADGRLASNSPCIDTGTTNGAPSVDLDGVARPLDGDHNGTAEFDLGAYEFASPLADTDHDGQNDEQEAIAGTDGTSSNAYFCSETAIGPGQGFGVSWETCAGRLYSLRKSTTLTNGWSDVAGQTNLPGTGGAIVYTGTLSSVREFYTVKVRRAP